MSDETQPLPEVDEALALPAARLDPAKIYRRLVLEHPTFVRGYLSALLESEQLDDMGRKQVAALLLPQDAPLDSKKAMLKDALDTLAFYED